ncbi:hypothetical protein QFC21_005365 [Naganishia friedmannii]|uniref:Uncharacterized protein n=1 Tax=Naganishia friedmannii TaxID=89922 RepID=A0ACC2VBQ7_9TREE|nr:hypothetical protein QFC21_005365 [Naganishia friedmannii]
MSTRSSSSSTLSLATDSPTKTLHEIPWEDDATLFGGSKRNSHSEEKVDIKTADILSVPVLLEKQALNTIEKRPIDGSEEDVYPDGGLQMIAGYGAFNMYYHKNLLSEYPLSVTAWIGSVSSCVTFAGATIGGTVMDRFGPRKVMMAGTTIMSLGFLLLSFCTELWQFFLCQSLFISSGIALMFVCPMTSANDWFKARRSMASGVVMSGASAGSIVWPLMVANLPQLVGWNWTVRVIALCQFLLLSLATILLRLRPRPATKVDAPPVNKHMFYWRAFATHPVYLLTSISSFCFSFGYYVFLFFVGTFALQKGWIKEAPYVLIACNASSAIGRIGAGFVADRVGRYNVLFLTTFSSAIVLFSWLGANSVVGIFVVAVVYGIMTGGNVALQSVCVVQATKDLEHLGVTGTLIGQQFGFQAIAVLIGPPISGYILGTSGSVSRQLSRLPFAIGLNGSVIMIGAGYRNNSLPDSRRSSFSSSNSITVPPGREKPVETHANIPGQSSQHTVYLESSGRLLYLYHVICKWCRGRDMSTLSLNTPILDEQKQERCQQCLGDQLFTDHGAGHIVCMTCGNIVSDTILSADIEFGEGGGGAAFVQGSFVADNATGARFAGPGRRQGGTESREQTLANGRKACNALAHLLNLGQGIADAGARWFNLAVTYEFTKGRKQQYVIAACLYIACRKVKNDVMLIDFSDKLHVNVFELGSTYLKLVRKLNLKDIPLIDPSIYIARFAGLLEFGEDTRRVAQDASRLVSRFERDWMQTGRRPSGICGACLILAARMNNYRRSVAEVVQVVKIADVTLRKRLAEFGATESSQLTVTQFREMWLADADKPPAMIRNLKKEAEQEKRAARRDRGVDSDESTVDEDADEDVKAAKMRRRKRREQMKEERERAKRLRMEAGIKESDEESEMGTPVRSSRAGSTARATPDLHQAALRQLHGSPTPTPATKKTGTISALQHIQDEMARLEREREAIDAEEEAARLDENGGATSGPAGEDDILRRIEDDDRGLDTQLRTVHEEKDGESDIEDPAALLEEELDNPLVDLAVTGEIEEYMREGRPAELIHSLDEHEQRRMNQLKRKLNSPDEDLSGLDDGELDSYLLDEQAVKVKTMIWNKMNKEYLIKLYAKQAKQAGEIDTSAPPKPKRKKNNKLGPASTGMEAVQNLATHKKFSRKMNYDQLAKLMQEDSEEDGFDAKGLQRMPSTAPESHARRDKDNDYDNGKLSNRPSRESDLTAFDVPRADKADESANEDGNEKDDVNEKEGSPEIVEEDHDSHLPPATTAYADAAEEEEPAMPAWQRFRNYEEEEGFEEL